MEDVPAMKLAGVMLSADGVESGIVSVTVAPIEGPTELVAVIV